MKFEKKWLGIPLVVIGADLIAFGAYAFLTRLFSLTEMTMSDGMFLCASLIGFAGGLLFLRVGNSVWLEKYSRDAALSWFSFCLFIVCVFGGLSVLIRCILTVTQASENTVNPKAVFYPVFSLVPLVILYIICRNMTQSYPKKNTNARIVQDRRYMPQFDEYTSKEHYYFVTDTSKDGLLTGHLYGTMRKDTEGYLAFWHDKFIKVKIMKLEVNGMEVAEASDTVLTVTVDALEAKDCPRYTILSDDMPQTEVSAEIPITNPVMTGMMRAFPDYNMLPGYYARLNYELAHTNFLTRFTLPKEPAVKGKTMVMFYSLTHRESKANAFAVFTDWNELLKWNPAMEEDVICRGMVITFREIVQLINTEKDSIVINPLSEKNMTLPPELIRSIINSDGYKEESEKEKILPK